MYASNLFLKNWIQMVGLGAPCIILPLGASRRWRCSYATAFIS